LDYWWGIDDTAITLAKSASSSSNGLLADFENVTIRTSNNVSYWSKLSAVSVLGLLTCLGLSVRFRLMAA